MAVGLVSENLSEDISEKLVSHLQIPALEAPKKKGADGPPEEKKAKTAPSNGPTEDYTKGATPAPKKVRFATKCRKFSLLIQYNNKILNRTPPEISNTEQALPH